LQLLTRELEVTQNACQETWSKRFTGMNWNHCGATVTVTNEVMAAFDSNHNKRGAAQC